MWRAIIAVSRSSLILAACGDGGPSDSAQSVQTQTNATTAAAPPASSGLTHAELVDRLNKLCDEGNNKLDPIKKRASRAEAEGDYAGVASAYSDAGKINDQFSEDLADLEPPAEDREAFDKYVRADRQQNGLISRLMEALRDRDDAASAL